MHFLILGCLISVPGVLKLRYCDYGAFGPDRVRPEVLAEDAWGSRCALSRACLRWYAGAPFTFRELSPRNEVRAARVSARRHGTYTVDLFIPLGNT